MASADIGANFSNYRGDAGLGEKGLGVIKIDTQPLMALAQYTFYYNRSVWEKNKEETDAKIKEIADLSKIRLNDLRGKDKDYATKAFVKLQKDAGDYARKTPANEQERLQAELDWQATKGAFLNDYDSGKTRAVSYQSRFNDINNSTEDAATKDIKIRLLNEEFDNTDIGTKISGIENFKQETIEVPKHQTQKINVIGIGANENIDMTATIYNPAANVPRSDAAVMGVAKLYPKKGTAEYDSLSKSQKEQADVQATIQGGSQLWTKMTEPLNEVIKKYIDEKGNFDAAKFEDDNETNTTLMGAYNALKNVDAYSRRKYAEASNGLYTDKGLSFKLPPNVNPNDFKAGFVDFSKGIKPNQLVQAGMYAEYAGDEVKKTIQETDNAIQRQQLAAQERMNREDNASAMDRAKLQAGWRFNAKGKLEPTIPTDAMGAFGNLIYGLNTPNPIFIGNQKDSRSKKLPKNVNIKDGVVVDEKGGKVDYTGDLRLPARYFDNSMLVEYNKYANSPATGGTGGAKMKFYTENGEYMVRMKNGEIQGIYADDSGNVDAATGKKGSLITVDQFQHITTVSAQKGVTKYNHGNPNYGKFPEQPRAVMSDEEFQEFLKRASKQ